MEYSFAKSNILNADVVQNILPNLLTQYGSLYEIRFLWLIVIKYTFHRRLNVVDPKSIHFLICKEENTFIIFCNLLGTTITADIPLTDCYFCIFNCCLILGFFFYFFCWSQFLPILKPGSLLFQFNKYTFVILILGMLLKGIIIGGFINFIRTFKIRFSIVVHRNAKI